MRVAIVADVYPPLKSSGAVQLRDLSREFAEQGHETVVLVASPELDQPWKIDTEDSLIVARLQSPTTKDISYTRRLAGEFLMPFAMMRNYSKCPLSESRYDAIIWYSPTIFLGPFVRWLKQRNGCRSYLIVRDIFPQWAADMGLISRGLPFQFLNQIANYQYRSADVIGVQTPGNLSFFSGFRTKHPALRVEVLQNWLTKAPDRGCAIDISRTKLAGRHIFVYAGNMGVAQQMDKLLNLACAMRDRQDVGFLFVGRGSEVQRLRQLAAQQSPNNILFEDEISPDDIPGLYRQCHVGMICLDSRHRTHNIPGKFLTYMQSGLPILASINDGNDLRDLVETHRVGRVSIDPSGNDLVALVDAMLSVELVDPGIATRCHMLSDELFSSRAAVQQIISALT